MHAYICNGMKVGQHQNYTVSFVRSIFNVHYLFRVLVLVIVVFTGAVLVFLSYFDLVFFADFVSACHSFFSSLLCISLAAHSLSLLLRIYCSSIQWVKLLFLLSCICYVHSFRPLHTRTQYHLHSLHMPHRVPPHTTNRCSAYIKPRLYTTCKLHILYVCWSQHKPFHLFHTYISPVILEFIYYKLGHFVPLNFDILVRDGKRQQASVDAVVFFRSLRNNWFHGKCTKCNVMSRSLISSYRLQATSRPLCDTLFSILNNLGQIYDWNGIINSTCMSHV